jgi:hypothetical protein
MMVFNRPEPTQKVFEAIRAARPPRLYVAADGARADRPGERALCEKTRAVATDVDWPCEVRTLFQEHNKGCKHGCAEAISWFFENEEEGIVFEDDDVPVPSFFALCDELLERYRHDTRVGQIGGLNPAAAHFMAKKSYVFTVYPFIWGWAGWRRAWKTYDLEMKDWPAWRDRGGLASLSAGNKRFERYWTSILDLTHAGEINTYDYQWIFACWANGMVSIVPAVNQIDNIGFGADATHTVGPAPVYVRTNPAAPLPLPLTHPEQVLVDPVFERIVNTKVLGLTAGREMRKLLYRIPFVQRLRNMVKNRR